MHIAICGSMAFSREMLAAKQMLGIRGISCVVPKNADLIASDQIELDDKWAHAKGEAVRAWFKHIEAADAIVVVNHERHGTNGYIGASTFAEMTYAYVLGKPIYLMRAPARAALSPEISVFDPIVLHDNLDLIDFDQPRVALAG